MRRFFIQYIWKSIMQYSFWRAQRRFLTMCICWWEITWVLLFESLLIRKYCSKWDLAKISLWSWSRRLCKKIRFTELPILETIKIGNYMITFITKCIWLCINKRRSNLKIIYKHLVISLFRLALWVSTTFIMKFLVFWKKNFYFVLICFIRVIFTVWYFICCFSLCIWNHIMSIWGITLRHEQWRGLYWLNFMYFSLIQCRNRVVNLANRRIFLLYFMKLITSFVLLFTNFSLWIFHIFDLY